MKLTEAHFREAVPIPGNGTTRFAQAAKLDSLAFEGGFVSAAKEGKHVLIPVGNVSHLVPADPKK